MAIKLPIYMDYHATTPVDPRVIDAQCPGIHDDPYRRGRPGIETAPRGDRVDGVL